MPHDDRMGDGGGMGRMKKEGMKVGGMYEKAKKGREITKRIWVVGEGNGKK